MKKIRNKTDHPIEFRRSNVIGSRRFDNYLWSSCLFAGGITFFITGVSSYLSCDFLPFVQSKAILFFPQGVVMCFYGVLGLVFSFYLCLTAWWNVGSGYNEFNKKGGFVHIFRWGFPGRNRRIDLFYNIASVKQIRVNFKDGINPQRTIYMCVAGQRDIPLSEKGGPITLEEVEAEAYQLAKFLQVPLEFS